jgi:hypothetical protein
VKRLWLLLLTAGLTSGCGSFRAPPLPQGAATNATPFVPVDEAWAARLRRADTLYFSLTTTAVADTQPARQILELMQRSGQQVALGWAEIPSTQQPLFEQWKRQEISSTQLLDDLARPGRSAWLREGLRPDLRQVALGCPPELLGKIRGGETLSASEEALLPSGFRTLPEAFENFVESATASARLRHYDIRRLYRAHLVAEQTIAQNIVHFRRENPEVKLLIFLPNDIMIDPREIADFAAQKIPLRQMILDRARPLEKTRPQLLARRRGGFEIVNSAPGPAAHDRRLASPRLRT